MKFHKDPNNPDEMICDDCFQAQEEVRQDWMDDDIMEWADEMGDDWLDEDDNSEDE